MQSTSTRSPMGPTGAVPAGREPRLALDPEAVDYGRLVDTLPLVVYTDAFDEGPSTLHISPEIERRLGYPASTWRCRRELLAALVHPDDGAAVLADTERAAARSEGRAIDYRLVGRDGHVLWFHDDATVECDWQGRPTLARGIIVDVTGPQLVGQAERRTHELLLSIVESLPGALWVKDASTFRYVLVNSKHDELIELPASDVLGKDDFDLIPRQYASAYRANDILTLEAGMVEIPGEPVWTASGEQIWFKTTKVAIRNEDGTPRYVLGYATDVTESRQTEEALRESEERFRSLLANIPGAVYRCRDDDQWTMEFLSDGIEEIVGYPAADFHHNGVRAFSSVMHPEDTGRVDDAVREALERDEPFSIEHRLIDAQGNARWVQERGRGTADPDGAEQLIDGLILDISELKRAEADRDRMETDLRLAQKLESVGQLAAGIAHEINTPVQFVGDTISFVEDAVGDLLEVLASYRNVCAAASGAIDPLLLERVSNLEAQVDIGYLETRLPQAFARAFDGIDRVATIVKGMKGFARADQRRHEPADINQAIRDTLVVARNEWKYVAELELDLGDLPLVVCNIGDLNQVFLNLIVNAAQAIAEGRCDDEDGPGTIHICTAQREDDWVIVTVADTGCGIPEAIRDRVFDPFFTTKVVGKGTGQGLAIARSILDRHGGTLGFESRDGGGTTFTIAIPAAQGAETRQQGNP